MPYASISLTLVPIVILNFHENHYTSIQPFQGRHRGSSYQKPFPVSLAAPPATQSCAETAPPRRGQVLRNGLPTLLSESQRVADN
jgi:hypothetical protein